MTNRQLCEEANLGYKSQDAYEGNHGKLSLAIFRSFFVSNLSSG